MDMEPEPSRVMAETDAVKKKNKPRPREDQKIM